MKKNLYKDSKVTKFVEGIPIEELPQEKLMELRRKNTEKAGIIITRYVNNLIEKGATEKEIVDFLKLGIDG